MPELPPRVENNVWVELSEVQGKIYRELLGIGLFSRISLAPEEIPGSEDEVNLVISVEAGLGFQIRLQQKASPNDSEAENEKKSPQGPNGNGDLFIHSGSS